MKFQYGNRVYDAGQMWFYRCDDPDIVGIYATPDYELVVAVAADPVRGLRACRIERGQLEQLAACLGAPDLLKALSR